jgi:CheY-like chemotaxis protein
MPRASTDTPHHSHDAPPAPPARRPLDARILLVEDSEDIQLLVSHILQRAGATLDLAANGKDGVRMAVLAHNAHAGYHAILMDIQMPDMDGNATTAALRALGIKTPIIALTAAALEKNREQALAAGCNDFLVKPIDINQLLEVLRRWIDHPPANPTV